MIRHARFQNFKALHDVSVDLGRLTVLVGPNGSGKTSVLQALRQLTKAESVSEEDRARCFHDPSNLRRMTTHGTGRRLTLSGSGDRGSFTSTWTVYKHAMSDGKGSKEIESVECESSGTVAPDAVSAMSEECFVRFGPAVYLQLEAKRLALPSYSEQPLPALEPDGEGLASVLAHIAANDTDKFQQIKTALRQVVPSVSDIRTPRAKVIRPVTETIEANGKTFTRREDREFWGNSIEFDMEGAPALPADMASEGTLLLLGLLTAIMGPARPRIVLLDDLDRALHPRAQEQLVELLRKLLSDLPDLQIVATSHSPYLLDYLQPEEVRITTRRDDGTVAVKALDAHPEFARWREEMTPGEFWSVVGESWIVGADVGEHQE